MSPTLAILTAILLSFATSVASTTDVPNHSLFRPVSAFLSQFSMTSQQVIFLLFSVVQFVLPKIQEGRKKEAHDFFLKFFRVFSEVGHQPKVTQGPQLLWDSRSTFSILNQLLPSGLRMDSLAKRCVTPF